MTTECSVAEYLSHLQNRKPVAFHIFMSTLFHKRNVIQEYVVKLTLNNTQLVANNNINKNNNDNYSK